MRAGASSRSASSRDLATLQVSLPAGALRLQAPGQPALELPRAAGGAPCRVQIWRDDCAAIDAGEAAARWLHAWLGSDFRLVRFDPAQPRFSSREWTGGLAAPTLFSDGFPLLVLGQASLDDLAARAGRSFPVERFRPNILLDGLDAYAEDRIGELTLGAVRLKLVKPCTRCSITTTDPQTGERIDDEPLRTLRAYRYDARLQGVIFAQNAILLAGAGAQLTPGQSVAYTLRG